MPVATVKPTVSPHHNPLSPTPLAPNVSAAPTGRPNTQNPRKFRLATSVCRPMPLNTPPAAACPPSASWNSAAMYATSAVASTTSRSDVNTYPR